MATITINGSTFTGDNITINGQKLVIDGVVQKEAVALAEPAEVRIVEGKLSSLKTDRSVVATNTVIDTIDAKGSVNCADVGGAVIAGGSVNCDDIKGNVSAGGSVNCDDIGGSVTAGGSVRRG